MTGLGRAPEGAIVSSIAIANFFIFLTILCLALSAELGMPLHFVFSAIAVALAGALRHDELDRAGARR
jgi:hypothetical protein